MGADRAILLTDRKFAGADTLATSQALAGALRMIEWDLIISGRQAIDGDTAQVGPQIAEHLSIPQVTYVEGLEYDGNNKFVIRKQTEEGYQILEVDSPVLITVLSSANKARYMSVSGIVDAFKKEEEIWSAEKIDVKEESLGLKGSPTKVHKAFTKGVRASGLLYEVGAEEAVGIIISKLKEKFII
jgi:electron transfer flavoprotein beta subunit